MPQAQDSCGGRRRGKRRCEALLDLCALNRGILLTRFQNMVLMRPATSAEDVHRHVKVFSEAVNEMTVS